MLLVYSSICSSPVATSQTRAVLSEEPNYYYYKYTTSTSYYS